MKLHIVYKITDSPWGGGNQFIKFLKKSLKDLNLISDAESADIILFNSHHDFEEIINLKKKYPHKKFVHRIDGPMKLYNNMDDNRDEMVYTLNSKVADAIIFQSKFSEDANRHLGLETNKPTSIIYNQADPEIFYPKKNIPVKSRIISASYSSNPKKGFDTYKYLDDNLDFSNIDYVFAGNSPRSFNRIKNIGLLTSNQLSEELRRSSIYITASQNDPCSNSLIEAISTKTPVIALKSGGILSRNVLKQSMRLRKLIWRRALS